MKNIINLLSIKYTKYYILNIKKIIKDKKEKRLKKED